MVAALARKEAQIVLGGIVGRAENRAMLTYLNITLVPVGEVAFNGSTAVVLVDTQPGRINNSLPEGIVPVAVIDHHPAYDDYPGVPFLDLRDQYGATSTIVTEYLRESKLVPEPKIADRKSTRLNSSHVSISYAVFCLKKRKCRHYLVVEFEHQTTPCRTLAQYISPRG